tara:strand:+ start:217 stop:810 length:594 start_codon:yes stop_codon:yes gene_type:complete
MDADHATQTVEVDGTHFDAILISSARYSDGRLKVTTARDVQLQIDIYSVRLDLIAFDARAGKYCNIWLTRDANFVKYGAVNCNRNDAPIPPELTEGGVWNVSRPRDDDTVTFVFVSVEQKTQPAGRSYMELAFPVCGIQEHELRDDGLVVRDVYPGGRHWCVRHFWPRHETKDEFLAVIQRERERVAAQAMGALAID